MIPMISSPSHKVVSPVSLEPVRVRPTALPSQRQRIWTAIRVLKRFDLPALQMASESTYGSLTNYVNWLHRAGYLHRENRAVPAQGKLAVYRLVRPSGRQAPKVDNRRRDGTTTVTDRNTGQSFGVTSRTKIKAPYVR